MTRKPRRGRGEGSVIFDARRGLWVASLDQGRDDKGKRIRVRFYSKEKSEVLEKMKEMTKKGFIAAAESTLPSPSIPPSSPTPLSSYLPHWLESIARSRLSETTHQRYKELLEKRILPHLGSVRLGELTAQQVQELYLALEKEGVSPRGRQMAGMVLGTALRDAVELGMIPTNVSQNVRKPRVETPEIQTFSPQQVQAFLAEARQDRLWPLYVLAIDTGARQGELFALRWTDIDWRGKSVRIVRSLQELRGSLKVKDLKTKASRRTIALSPVSIQVLAKHRAEQIKKGTWQFDDLVFSDRNGNWLRKGNVLRRSFYPILERAKVPEIKFHALRHTMATLLLSEGEAIKVVQERLGHAAATTTMNTYAHSIPGAQKHAAEKMNRHLRTS